MSEAVLESSASRLVPQMLRFVAVGVANTGIGLAVVFLLHLGLGLGVTLSNVVGYAVGIWLSFALNRSWTFRTGDQSPLPIFSYLILVAIAFAANLAVIRSLTDAGLSYLPSQIAGVAIYSAIVFVGMKHVIFAKS